MSAHCPALLFEQGIESEKLFVGAKFSSTDSSGESTRNPTPKAAMNL
jgi:hypothetical protein